MSWYNWWKPQKTYPLFWQNYLSHFKSSKPTNLVAFDCETTGLDPTKDRLLSIGAVRFTKSRIFVSKSHEWFLHQDNPENDSIKIHGILPSTSKTSILSEKEAIIHFLEFIRNATLVGHHINFDYAMINQALKRLGVGKLKNRLLDTNDVYKKKKHIPFEQNFGLDELSNTYEIKPYNRHTALGDAYITAQLYQKLSHL